MRSNIEVHVPPRAFCTPPATLRSLHSPGMMITMSERRRVSPGCKRDLFHVIHNVPSSDSPYRKAKQVQLIEKDPSRAISLFWAAINSGDRVDSALKDMAMVMKQLNRTDEAIEAIKSFRHLCSYDSQESVDNVLVELYKRSGRIEEEINILECKLKNTEKDMALGRKRTKTARSQGKKIQITVEQERARILGNLAWAYLQCHNYGLAEQHYRKAMALEPDMNRQCNLAICLMHMNRISEARSLLQAVRTSCGKEQMDDSYAKSYGRAFQILSEFESPKALKSTNQNEDAQKCLPSLTTIESKQVSGSTKEGQHCDPKFRGSRNLLSGQNEERDSTFVASNNGCVKYVPPGLRRSQSSPCSKVENNWRKCSYFESISETPDFSSRKNNESSMSSTGTAFGSANKETFTSPAPVLYTQPRIWADMQTVRWGAERSVRWGENVLIHTIRDLNGELLDPTDEKSEVSQKKTPSSLRSPTGDWRTISRRVVAGLENQRTRTSQEYDSFNGNNAETIGLTSCNRNAWENGGQRKYDLFHPEQAMSVDNAGILEASSEGQGDQISGLTVSRNTQSTGAAAGDKCKLSKSSRKSWADMAEEEEEQKLSGEGGFDEKFYGDFVDENLNSNLSFENSCPRSQKETVSQQIGALDFREGYADYRNTVSSSNNPTAWRSLCFEVSDDVDSKRKNKRLQVFRDITPDSP